MEIPQIYKTTEENLIAGIFLGLGGKIEDVSNDQLNTKNDLLFAIFNLVAKNNNGNNNGVKLTSQFGTIFKITVDEEGTSSEPMGIGSIQIEKE